MKPLTRHFVTSRRSNVELEGEVVMILMKENTAYKCVTEFLSLSVSEVDSSKTLDALTSDKRTGYADAGESERMKSRL